MENTLKIKVFIKSILFCKYLRNGSSDLYEILNLSSIRSNQPINNFQKYPCTNAHIPVVNARAHVLSRVSVADIFAKQY